MKKVFVLLAAIASCLLTACTTGMGSALDLEAPVITITSPKKLTYQGLEFSMEGTCSDNVGVTSVVISNSESEDSPNYKVYCSNATIDGNTWHADLVIPKEDEGDITFKATANDKAKNSSTKSVRQITLFVDQTAPEGLKWYIDRGNNNQVALMDKDELENLNLNSSKNVNIPQNQQFSIVLKMYDAMSIEKIRLILKDEDGEEVISKTITEASLNPGESIYNPSFTFTESDLTAVDSKYATGKHYFQVAYESSDKKGNEDIQDLDWLLWYPESDRPGIEIGTNDSNSLTSLQVMVNNSIPVQFFDDDTLAKVYWTLRYNCSYTADELRTNASARSSVFDSALSDNEVTGSDSTSSNSNYQIKVPSTPTDDTTFLKLIVYAIDNHGEGNARIVDVHVNDNEKPMVFVESPTENTIPEIVEGTKSEFKISGYTMDTKGCSAVKIAFIPNDIGYSTNDKKDERAREILKNDTKSTGSQIYSTGEMVWRQKLGTAVTTDGWKKQTFDFRFDMLDGFKSEDGNTIYSKGNDDKFFEIMVTDEDNNTVFQQCKTTGDTIKPSIKFIEPSEDMSVIDYSTNDLVIKYCGTKDTGLGMQDPEYKLTYKDGLGNEVICTLENGLLTPTYNSTYTNLIDYVTYTLPKADVKELCNPGSTSDEDSAQKTQEFYLSATDVLGNSTTEKLTLVLSPLPSLTSITSDKPDSTFKKGDTITLQANFSRKVKVDGAPRLKIYFSESDTTAKYAEYTRGSGTNSLTFTYTVKENDSSLNGLCTKSDSPIDLNSGSIQTDEVGNGDAHIDKVPTGKNLQDSKTLKIDGICPYIASISFAANVDKDSDTNYYASSAKTVTATLEANEQILISGTPTLNVKSGNNALTFSFQSISGKKITFIHKVDDSTKEGTVNYNYSSYFSSEDLAMIKDNAGNTLVLNPGGSNTNSNVVIDKTGPSTAPAINVAAGKYNLAQTLTLTPAETGGTIQYSLDDGVSWSDYSAAVKITSGTYYITTRQYDKAGNESPRLTTASVVINDTFPTPTAFTVKKADGKYKKGESIKFAMDFEDTVYAPTAGDVKITMVPAGKTTPEKVISSKAVSSSGATKVEFEMTVSGTDSFDGIQISKVEFTDGFVDDYGNVPVDSTKTALAALFADDSGTGGTRTGITLDGVAPTIKTYSPADNGVNTSDNDAYKVVLTFSEPVYAESGNITLQRKGDWAIPAVMTGTEFNEVYNNSSLTSAQKQLLHATTSSGDDRVDSRTGISVGPYKKITQGLTTSGSTLVPDTATKYVLDFNLGLYSGSTTLDEHASDGGLTVNVSDIRNVFEATGYHQEVVDVTSKYVSISSNVVTITFPETIADGIEWELLVDSTAFRDATGNSFAGLEEGDYTLWSNKVSKPVVRVDRYSHGYGAKEPSSTGALTEITGYTTPNKKCNLDVTSVSTSKTGNNTKPTAYARVRIDSQTPGASITYKTIEKSVINTSTTNGAYKYYFTGSGDSDPTPNGSNCALIFTNNNANLDFTITKNEDAEVSDLAFTSGGTEYSSYVIVGDGLLTTARKDYVSAYATKSGLTDSDYGYEGVFKTVILAAGRDGATNIEGGTAKGGEPVVSGFPVRDATSDIRYSKNMYAESGTNNRYWISYEMITNNWAILVHRNNYSTNYPYSSYGQITYLYMFSTWE